MPRYERKHRSCASFAGSGGKFASPQAFRIYPLVEELRHQQSLAKLLKLEGAALKLLGLSRESSCFSCGAALKPDLTAQGALSAAKLEPHGVLCCTARPDDFELVRAAGSAQQAVWQLYSGHYIADQRLSDDRGHGGSVNEVQALVLESYQLPLNDSDRSRLQELWRRALESRLKRISFFQFLRRTEAAFRQTEFELLPPCPHCGALAHGREDSDVEQQRLDARAVELLALWQRFGPETIRSSEAEVLRALCEIGLGEISLALLPQQLSTVQALKLRLLLLELARPSGLNIFVCGLSGLVHRSEHKVFSDVAMRLTAAGNHVVLDGGAVAAAAPPGSGRPTAGGPQIALEQLSSGSLKIVELRVPCSALTVVRGPAGSGKTVLLEEILQPIFKARSKQAASFKFAPESIDRKYFGQVIFSPFAVNFADFVGVALGLERPLTRFLASLPEAKLLGLKPADLELGRSSRRCRACGGSGLAQDFAAEHDRSCAECEGQRFEPEIAALRYSGFGYGDLLNLPLRDFCARLGALLKLGNLGEQIELCSLGEVPYGLQYGALSLDQFQKLRLLCSFSEIYLQGAVRRPALILLDYPLVGLNSASRQVGLQLLHEFVASGHTVIITDNAETLTAGQVDQVIELGVSYEDGQTKAA